MDWFESYADFADHARDIIGYGDWTYKSKKALHDLNEWLLVGEEGPVTQDEMEFLESMYRDLHRDELDQNI